jgi:peptidoglycan/xylan/chitin deacetylase (PgdA/CDA1 family)
MDVGSHTRTHANLPELSPATAQDEIFTSKRELEQALGCEVRHFCYPYGKYTAEHAHMARQAGYATATTTHRGRVQAQADPYTLRRIMVARATNPVLFAAKIITRYEDKRA